MGIQRNMLNNEFITTVSLVLRGSIINNKQLLYWLGSSQFVNGFSTVFASRLCFIE